MKYIVQRNDETLDEIVHNKYGASFGYLEMVLSANSNLIEEGIYLTEGLEIYLPEIKQKVKKRETLW